MDYGKQASRNIDERLMGESRWSRLFPDFMYDQKAPDEPGKSRRHVARAIPAKVRVRTNDEVITGLVAEEAWEESCRCLRCDIRTHVSVS
jgi:hypothetical protein